jgi:G3E family GTPase
MLSAGNARSFQPRWIKKPVEQNRSCKRVGASLMDKKIHFAMIGGFLGAGKTTCIARLAAHFTEQGKRVAIVTNDQAFDLVDTHHLRAQGFEVGEVPGSCFCCKFDDLLAVTSRLSEEHLPDIILAEPVGSCTDLMATVIQPMRHLYGERFQLGPLAVLLKPEHGRKILREESGVGFSPKAAYIFLKQIEEADVIAINKVDKLAPGDRDELVRLVEKRFPNKKAICVSGRSGENFEQLIAFVEQPSERNEPSMEVDYDIYAEGEAELGWLNCQLALKANAAERFELDLAVVQLVDNLRALLAENDAEPAHLKVMGQYKSDAAVANLVDSASPAELSLASEIRVPEADLIVNARVAIDPELLENVIRDAAARLAENLNLTFIISGVQSFRPGRPVPTHRM